MSTGRLFQSVFARRTTPFLLSIILIMSVVLTTGLLPPQPVEAEGGTFPASPFNGMQITYSISGATVTESKDAEGFTVSRTVKGTLGTGNLAITGSGKMGGGYYADLVATVSCNGKTDKFTANIKSGYPGFNSESFSLSVPIPSSAASGSFSIDMTGHYNAGTRGLVVSGTFGGAQSSSPASSSQQTSAEDPPPGPLTDKLPAVTGEERVFIEKVEGNPIYVSADSPGLPPSQRKWVKIMPGNYRDGKKYVAIGEHWTVRTPSGSETLMMTRTGAVWRQKERSWYDHEIYRPTWSDEWKRTKEIYGRLWQGVSNFYFPKGGAKAREMGWDLNTVVVGIKGTNFVAEVTEQSDTIKVIEGEVQLTHYNTGTLKTITSGQQLTATQSGLGNVSSFDVQAEKAKWGSFYAEIAGATPQTSPTGTQGKGFPLSLPNIRNCIAKTAYESENCPQISLLRQFRDRALMPSALGKAVMNAYYEISPQVTLILSENEALRRLVRDAVLEPLVFALDKTMPLWNRGT